MRSDPQLTQLADEPLKLAAEIERLFRIAGLELQRVSAASGVIASAGGTVATAGPAGPGGTSGGNPGGGGSGITGFYTTAVAGESGIVVGSWVSVRNGYVAYLATSNSFDGGGLPNRIATGVCVAVNPGRLTIQNCGGGTVRSTVWTVGEGALWLASAKGWATDAEPAIGSGLVSQKVAVKADTGVTTGLCRAGIQISGVYTIQ